MKTKVRTKAIPISAAMLAELHKYSPGEGEIDMDKLPPALRKKLLDMAGEAIASDDDDEESGCQGCEAEQLASMAGILHGLIKDKPAEEVVKDLRAGDTPMAKLIEALEQRVKVRPDLLRDPEFTASVHQQMRRAMVDTLMAEIKGKAKPEPEYEPQYEMIVEHVILKKTKGEKLERVYQRFVKITDSVSDRAFNELAEAMRQIAPDDAWSIIDTGDDDVSAIGCKVDGAKYQAKQIGHKLRVG